MYIYKPLLTGLGKHNFWRGMTVHTFILSPEKLEKHFRDYNYD